MNYQTSKFSCAHTQTFPLTPKHWALNYSKKRNLGMSTRLLTLMNRAKIIHNQICHRLLWKNLEEFFEFGRSYFDAIPNCFDNDHSFLGWRVRSDQHLHFSGNQFLTQQNFSGLLDIAIASLGVQSKIDFTSGNGIDAIFLVYTSCRVYIMAFLQE